MRKWGRIFAVAANGCGVRNIVNQLVRFSILINNQLKAFGYSILVILFFFLLFFIFEQSEG